MYQIARSGHVCGLSLMLTFLILLVARVQNLCDEIHVVMVDQLRHGVLGCFGAFRENGSDLCVAQAWSYGTDQSLHFGHHRLHIEKSTSSAWASFVTEWSVTHQKRIVSSLRSRSRSVAAHQMHGRRRLIFHMICVEQTSRTTRHDLQQRTSSKEKTWSQTRSLSAEHRGVKMARR